jgi:hypothetical protein
VAIKKTSAKSTPSHFQPIRANRPGWEYQMIDVPLEDLRQLDAYGEKGWRCVAVVGRGTDSFQALIERDLRFSASDEDDDDDVA